MSSNEFTASQALSLVSAYFETEWPKTALTDVHLTRVTGGFVNRLHLLRRTNKAEQEPNSILIRHFGRGDGAFHEEPLASKTTLSSAEQALIYHEMGQRGWGPRLHGAFKGGRLEEYIDAHPLTAAEAADASIRRDVARSYARLHSLELPFRKEFTDMAQELKDRAMGKSTAFAQDLLGLRHKDAYNLAMHFRAINWEQELNWVTSLFQKHHCKSTIAVGDTNFLNVLVKNYESDCRAVLIDYETCTYSYRGVDIGGHFNERMYCWSDPDNQLTGHPAPDEEEQRSFCRSYLEEMRELGVPLTGNDTEEHLLLEAQIGRLWQLLFSVAMCFSMDELPDDPALFVGLAHMLDTYADLKERWNSVPPP